MDFLTKLYAEEQEKNAGAEVERLFDQMSIPQLEQVLGLDKKASWYMDPKGEAMAKELEKAKPNKSNRFSHDAKQIEDAASRAKKSLEKK
jgi:hypothetical protein